MSWYRRSLSAFPLALVALSGITLPTVSQGAWAGAPPQKASNAPAANNDADVVSVLMQAETGPTGAGGPPPVWFAQFEKAVYSAQSGKRALAEAQFRQLLKTQPRLSAARANLAILEAQSERYPAAIADMNLAVSTCTEPHQKTTLLIQLAGMYGRVHRWTDSAEAARKAQALSPAGAATAKIAEAYVGIALLHAQRYADALPILSKKLIVPGEAPQAGDLRYIFGLEQSGHLVEALAAAKGLQRRYSSDPKSIGAVESVADSAVRAGRMDIALDAFEFAFNAYPTDERRGLNVVAAAVRLGALSNSPQIHAQADALAADTFERLLRSHPDDPKIHYEYGTLLFSTRTPDMPRLKHAESELRTAVLKEPKNTAFLTQLALAVVLQGPNRLDEGLHEFQGALRQDPTYTMALLGLGYAYEQQAETDKEHKAVHFRDALREYTAVIAQNKTSDSDAKARNRKAGIEYSLGDKDGAYRDWEAMIARYPTTYGVDTEAETASRLLADKRYPDATRDYLRLIARDPNDIDAYLGLGKTEEQTGDLVAAQRQYEKAVSLSPTNTMAALALAELLRTKNHRPDEAIVVYENTLKALAVARTKNDPAADEAANRIRLQLGSDYAEAKRPDDALKMYRSLTIRKDDADRSLYLLMAPRFLINEKRYVEAEKDLTEMQVENPTDREVGYELARAQELASHGDAAIATLKALAEHAGDTGERLRAQGQVAALYVRLNRFDEGAKQYEDILLSSPTQQEALRGLSGARQRQGHSEAAGSFLEDLALAGNKTPNIDLVRDLYTLYTTMDQTPDRYRAFIVRLADHFADDRAAQALAIGTLLDPTDVGNAANHVAALRVVDRLLTKNAKDPEALYWRGLLREKDGHKSEAIDDYTAAVVANYGNGPAIAALKRLGAPVPQAPLQPPPAALPPATPTAAMPHPPTRS